MNAEVTLAEENRIKEKYKFLAKSEFIEDFVKSNAVEPDFLNHVLFQEADAELCVTTCNWNVFLKNYYCSSEQGMRIFQILWKSRWNILVSFPSHLKKLCSILRF